MKKWRALIIVFALFAVACGSGQDSQGEGDEANAKIGDTGPGGGIIFFAEGGQYKECSGELGAYNWAAAITTAHNYNGSGFTDWHLPDRSELNLMYENLHKKGKGEFSKSEYWSSTEYSDNAKYAVALSFEKGSWSVLDKNGAYKIRAVRSYTVDTTKKTTLVINNFSDYSLIDVEYSGVSFGTIDSGKAATKDVSAGTKYVFFSLRTVNGDVRCRMTEIVTCEESKKLEKTIYNNTYVTSTEDGQKDVLEALFTALNRTATLKIKNESFVEVSDVIWQNVSFANNQYENSIKPGTTVTNNVQAGAGYIFFKRKSNPISARTAQMVIVAQYEDIEFTLEDDTPIVEVNNTANSGTLGSLQSTVVWWDDAEGEVQPYTLKQSFVGYYATVSDLLDPTSSRNNFYSPKNGNKSIAVGGTTTALLQLKINLERSAKLSFWYANKRYNTGTTFSINGVVKATWNTDVDWSFLTFDLEPGENDLKWEKKDGYYSGSYSYSYYYYLSLDDILIYYTE